MSATLRLVPTGTVDLVTITVNWSSTSVRVCAAMRARRLLDGGVDKTEIGAVAVPGGRRADGDEEHVDAERHGVLDLAS